MANGTIYQNKFQMLASFAFCVGYMSVRGAESAKFQLPLFFQ